MDSGCKTEFARLLRIERSGIYHHYTTQEERDKEDIDKLVVAHLDEPKYGVKRLALMLNWSIDKTRRIRDLAGIQAFRRKKLGYKPKQEREIPAPPNLLRQYWELKDPTDPKKGYTFEKLTDPELNIWVQDFTYFKVNGENRFLAVVIQLSTRIPIGWAVGKHHDKELVCRSLEDALSKHPCPKILHNDQGSEYLSKAHAEICQVNNIKMSASDPGSPWQNGYCERFMNTFKDDCERKLERAKNDVEAYQIIAKYIYYYTYKRIHTALKMTPAAYAEKVYGKKTEPRKSLRLFRGAKSLLGGEPDLAPLCASG